MKLPDISQVYDDNRSRQQDFEIIDAIADTMTTSEVKRLLHQMVGFSCVPYKPNKAHWCNNCCRCWIDYLLWIQGQYK